MSPSSAKDLDLDPKRSKTEWRTADKPPALVWEVGLSLRGISQASQGQVKSDTEESPKINRLLGDAASGGTGGVSDRCALI